MRLRHIDFLPVYNAAGAQGFFGEGYHYHTYWKLLGLTYRDCGFISKTTTFYSCRGNMPLLWDGISPRDFKPECIVVKPWQGVVLNAVGLSGPGAEMLFGTGCWQKREGAPFFISFMSTSPSVDERLDELRLFVALFKKELKSFKAPVGLELNFSCPNVAARSGLPVVHVTDTQTISGAKTFTSTLTRPQDLVEEVHEALEIAARLRVPIQCKFSATTSVASVVEICKHPECDAITVSNTIPWGCFPEFIPWEALFGSNESPLAQFGGGGLSGWPLFHIVWDWIRLFRQEGCHTPVWACGGISHWPDIGELHRVGASGVQLGTIGMLRPWRMRSLISSAHELFT